MQGIAEQQRVEKQGRDDSSVYNPHPTYVHKTCIMKRYVKGNCFVLSSQKNLN